MRRLALVLSFVLVGLASLVLSTWLHLDSAPGRAAGRAVLVELVSAEIAGEVEAEEVLELSADGASLRGVTIRDPQGRPVIVAERVRVRFDPWALARGEVRFPLGEVERAELILHETEAGLPSFIDAFGPATPSDPNAPFEPGTVLAIVERLDLRELRVRGTLLGVEGLVAEDVNARLALRIDDRVENGFELRVDEARGRVVAPFGRELTLESVSATVRDDETGTRLHARLRTAEGEQLGALLTYAPRARDASAEGGTSGGDADPSSDAVDELELLVHLDPVRARTLAESGLADWAEPLLGEVRGHVRLRGPPERLTLGGWVRTDGGGVAIEGTLASEGPSEVSLRTAGLQVDRTIDGAPSARVRGRVSFTLPPEGAPRVVAELEPFRLGELEVPPTRVEGTLGEEHFEIERARVVTGDGAIEARGRVGYDGSVDLRVEGELGELADDPTLRALVPGLRADGRFEATVRVGADGTIASEGRWVLRDFRYGPAYAGLIVATGRIDGELEAPRVALRLALRDVRVEGRRLGDGSGRVSGGPNVFGFEVALAAPIGRAATGNAVADADASVASSNDDPNDPRAMRALRRGRREVIVEGRADVSDGVRVDLARVELVEGRQRWTGSIDALVSRGSLFSIERARFENGEQRLEGGGRWLRRVGDDALTLSASNLELGRLRRLLDGFVGELPDVDGRLSGSATIGGDLERQPTVRVDATLADGRVGPLAGVDGSLLVQYADGTLVADLGVVARDAGELELDVTGTVDRTMRLRDAVPYAALRVEGEARDLDLALLRHLPFELPDLHGRATGSGHAEGGFDAFDFEGQVDVPALRVALPETWRAEGEDELSPPLGFRGRVGYTDGGLTLRGSFRDEGGQLAEAETSVLLDLQSLIEDPSLLPSLLDVAPWRLALRLPPRRVDRWPAFLRRDLPSPENLLASATLTLRGGAYRPAGDLSMNVAWLGPEEHGCGPPSRPRVEVGARLEDGITRVSLSGLVDDRRVIFGEAEAATPLDEWLAELSRASEGARPFELPSTRGTIWAIGVPLERIPYVCRELEGPVTASFELERLFGARPSLLAEISSDQLRVRRTSLDARGRQTVRSRSEPLSARVHVQLGNGRANADADLTWWNAGLTTARVGLPLVWGGEDLVPLVAEDARLDGMLELVDTPLEAALFWVPQVDEARGGLFGTVDVRGMASDPLLEGEIELRDGRLSIPALGQRLEDVEGILVLEGHTLVLQRFEAHDGDGVASIAGDVTLERFSPVRADLALDAEGFPVRQEGSVLARLTGQSQLGARLFEGGLEGNVTVDGLSIWLGDDAGRTPQSLAPHPDVVVLGSEVEASDEEPYAVSLHVDATRPFTIKGEDFAAELVALLELGYVDALQLKGEVELRSGHFDIFGKRFDVERGALFFDGETDLDPSVNLVAVHELRSRSGETVTVTASGRLSAPVIRFASSLTNDRAEIVALLVSGEVRGDNAQDVERAPTDFLAGIAAGVLTLSLREEFGQVVPTIVVEGNAYGGTRIRGGWRLEEVLPESLRDVIRGVYIEGFFNTTGQDGEGSRRTVGQVLDYGFLLELALPRDVVNTNTFTPPNNFSLDVTWQP